MRRSWLLRTLTIALALLHLMVPQLVAVADARLAEDAARSGHPRVHVESHGSPRCPRVHPSDCELCHYASGLLATPARAPQGAPAVARPFAVPPADRPAGVAVGACSPSLPRAPPSA